MWTIAEVWRIGDRARTLTFSDEASWHSLVPFLRISERDTDRPLPRIPSRSDRGPGTAVPQSADIFSTDAAGAGAGHMQRLGCHVGQEDGTVLVRCRVLHAPPPMIRDPEWKGTPKKTLCRGADRVGARLLDGFLIRVAPERGPRPQPNQQCRRED